MSIEISPFALIFPAKIGIFIEMTDRLFCAFLPENSALICYRLNLTIYMGEYE